MLKRIFLGLSATTLGMMSLVSVTTPVTHAGRFEDVIQETLEGGEQEFGAGKTVNSFLEKNGTAGEIGGAESLRDFLIMIGVQVIIPIIIFAGIIIAILGFYRLMNSENDEELAKSQSTIIWGVIGIVVMMTAGYLVNTFVGVDGTGGTVYDFSGRAEGLDGPALAATIYNSIAFPFLNMFLIFAMGILFAIVLVNAFKLIFSQEDIQSKAISMIIYAVIGILVITSAKTIVELVYGTYDQVVVDLEGGMEGELGKVGQLFSGVGPEGEALVRVRAIINWILGLATFIVVVLIIYLGYKMLLFPDDENNLKEVKNYMLYMLIGIFIIGSAYILSRMLIVTG